MFLHLINLVRFVYGGSVGYAIMAQVSGLLYQYISPFANFMAGILGTLITIICIYMVSDPKLSEVPEKEENKLSTVVVMKELVHNIPFMLFLVISFSFGEHAPQTLTIYHYLLNLKVEQLHK